MPKSIILCAGYKAHTTPNLAVEFTEIECTPITTAKRVCDDGGGESDDDDTSTVNMVPYV